MCVMPQGRVVSFWLRNELIEQLDERASDQGVSRTAVVREAITHSIGSTPHGEPSSLEPLPD